MTISGRELWHLSFQFHPDCIIHQANLVISGGKSLRTYLPLECKKSAELITCRASVSPSILVNYHILEAKAIFATKKGTEDDFADGKMGYEWKIADIHLKGGSLDENYLQEIERIKKMPSDQQYDQYYRLNDEVKYNNEPVDARATSLILSTLASLLILVIPTLILIYLTGHCGLQVISSNRPTCVWRIILLANFAGWSIFCLMCFLRVESIFTVLQTVLYGSIPTAIISHMALHEGKRKND